MDPAVTVEPDDPRRYDREILRLAIPALGGLAVEPLYVLVDTAIVGHLGTHQLGGLAVAGILLTTGFWLFNFLAYGTTAVVARRHGADDERGAAERTVEAVWLAAAIGFALVLIVVVITRPAVRAMGASADVQPFAITYMRISAFGAPALLIALVGTGHLRGLQNTKTSLMINVGANVLNLALEIVAVYGLGYGIAASAAATVIAQWCAASVYLAIVVRNVNAKGVTWRPSAAGLKLFAAMGATLMLRTGALMAAFTVATSVAARISDTAVAAHQIPDQIWLFLAFVLDAVAIAAQAMIGRALGANQPEQARAMARRMVRWALWCGVGCALFVVVSIPWLPLVFSDDTRVIREARRVFWILAVQQPIGALVFVLDGVLVGASDMRYLASGTLFAAACFIPAALLILQLGGGLVALWLALTGFLAVRAIANWIRFTRGRWTGTPSAPPKSIPAAR